jgi:hypothetical protein
MSEEGHSVTMIRPFPVAVILLLSTCSVPPLAFEGKACTAACPDGLMCVSGVCRSTPLPADGGGGMNSTPDASAMTMPDASVSGDGGVCQSCTATQVCVDSTCKEEADISGSFCVSKCPTGFACLGNTCLKKGQRLCSTIKQTPTLCTDFDGPEGLGNQWMPSVSGAPEGTLKIDTTEYRSAPASMLSSINGPGSATPLRTQVARFEREVPMAAQKVTVAFDFKPSIGAIGSGRFVSFVEFYCENTKPDGGIDYEGAWVQYLPGNSGNEAKLVKSGGLVSKVLAPQPAAAAWSRIRVEFTRSPSRAVVFVDEVDAGGYNLLVCPKPWRVHVGLSGSAPAEARIDNIIYLEE